MGLNRARGPRKVRQHGQLRSEILCQQPLHRGQDRTDDTAV